jgi:hypothetical protein
MSVFSPPPWFWPSMGTVVLAALGLAIKAFRSYRNSLSKDSEKFHSYVLVLQSRFSTVWPRCHLS